MQITSNKVGKILVAREIHVLLCFDNKDEPQCITIFKDPFV